MSSSVSSWSWIGWPLSSRITLQTWPPRPTASIEAGDFGLVVQQQAVGAIDAGHLDVAAGGVVAQAGPHADRVDHAAELAGHFDGVPAVLWMPSERRIRPRRPCPAPLRRRLQRPRERRGLAVRGNRWPTPRFLERLRRSANSISVRSKSLPSFSHHFSTCCRASVKRLTPEASSAMLIEAERSMRKIRAGFSCRSCGSSRRGETRAAARRRWRSRAAR